MGTFKAYFKKEILESKRQFRYLIVILAFVFLALSNPIMLKLLPKILESANMPGLDAMLPKDKLTVMQNLHKDFFQTGVLVMVFTFCGILSDELNNHKFVFPFSKGAEPKFVIAAKTLHYSLLIFVAIFLGIFVNYYYVDLIFEGTAPAISGILFSAFLISLFFVFNLMLTMLFSLFVRKGIIAGIIVAIFQYFSALPASIKYIKDFMPYNLFNAAGSLKISNQSTLIAVTILYIVIIAVINTVLLKKKEVIQ